MGKRYNNYHKHTHYSNISTLDVVVKPIDYINRAKELGHNTYFTTEHGWGSNIYEAYRLCKENDIKPIFAVEAYYVDYMNVKNSRDYYHIMLIAMTNNARKQLNRIISKSYTDGFYYKNRIDLECLLSLNPKEVVVTSACVATRLFKGEDWKKNFFLPVYNHFKDNFYLETQCHCVDIQKNLNKNILKLSKEYGVKLIHANDSHYIYPEDDKIRNQFLKAKDMRYPDENNFILDYPDYDEILRRYEEQGILTKEQAIEALNNTLIFDKAELIELNYEFKLPKIFKENSTKHLKRIILNEFNDKILNKDLNEEQVAVYKKELNYEFNIIKKCGMEDYFLLDYYIVKRAVEEYGAILTRTGRGSAVSFLTNYLLGFTQIDRLKSPVKLYPTRFMSAERILQTRSLPDIDLNWSNVDGVIKASKDYLGEDGVYYMVSYKPMQESSAFRLWCKSLDMNFEEYNEIGKNLDDYKDDEYWGQIIKDSSVFVGVIESISPSPCSVLLLDKPISEEIGLIKVGDVMCCALDGYNCDVFKYLKNDYLVVQVYTLISETYKLIGRPIDDIDTLVKNLDGKVWDLLSSGLTTTINQCDSDYDKQILSKYRPRSVAEISAYVASIRPGFKTLLDNFVNRLPYSTGVKQLDDLLEDSYHYMMYQESIMTYLTWLGIEEKETYDIIKKISKKKFKEKELKELKDKLFKGWITHVGKEEGFEETWNVVESSAKYSFNASHSLSVGLDALYGAYLKSHYPLEYFTVALTQYIGDETRTNNLISELPYFDIKLKPIKFRYSSDKYTMSKEDDSIYKGIASIKYCNSKIAKELYELRDNQYDTFIDLLVDINDKTSINSKQLNILVCLDFFSEFGEINTLLKQIEVFNAIYGKKTAKKNDGQIYIKDYHISLDRFRELFARNVLENGGEYKESAKQIKGFDSVLFIKEMCKELNYPATTSMDKIGYELQHLGYIQTIDPSASNNLYLVTSIDKKNKYAIVNLYSVKTGSSNQCKIWLNNFNTNPFDEGQFIKIFKLDKKNKRIPSDKVNPNTGKKIWIDDPSGAKDFFLVGYSVE